MRHELHRIGRHVVWFSPDARTDRPVLGAVVGRRGALMVDAGASPEHARAFLTALAERGAPPPRYLALTHAHWDHVFGMASVDAAVIAQRGTAAELQRMAVLDWSDAALDDRVEDGTEIAFCRDMIRLELPNPRTVELRTPDIVFDEGLVVDLGDATCVLRHVGGDHAADASVVHVPEDGVVFLGDCLSQAIYAPRQHYTPAKVVPLMEMLSEFDAGTFLEGHNPSALTREEFEEIAGTLRAVAEVAERTGGDPAAMRRALEQRRASSAGERDEEELAELVDLFAAGAAEGAGPPA